MRSSLLLVTLAAFVPLACGTGGNGPSQPAPGGATSLSGERMAVLQGTVLDAASGEPVPDAIVEAPGGISVRTDSRGRFRLAGLPVGASGELVARGPDGAEARNPLRPLRAGSLEVVIHLRRP